MDLQEKGELIVFLCLWGLWRGVVSADEATASLSRLVDRAFIKGTGFEIVFAGGLLACLPIPVGFSAFGDTGRELLCSL